MPLDVRSGISAEARNLIGIANSLLTVGYKAEESICTRDCHWGFGAIRFGDGMKRGLAIKLVSLDFKATVCSVYWCALLLGVSSFKFQVVCFLLQPAAF